MKPFQVTLLAGVVVAGFLAHALVRGPHFGRHPRPTQLAFQAPAPQGAVDPGPEPATPVERAKPGPGKSRPERAKGPSVSHQPQQPKSGQPVLITVNFREIPVPPGDLTLEYQVVNPGKYISRRDKAFREQWTPLPLAKGGESSSVFTAQVPASEQQHRRLVRYRVRGAERKIVAPDSEDLQPNYAYFVYDAVPPWKGAINPKGGDAKVREPVVYSSEALQRIPVYHFIGAKSSVEKATWTEGEQFGNSERNQYHYTGTIVYDGIVYDHVGFRARGGGWRHAMGKNMWKFNFLPGHRFQARDDYGNRYNSKWDKLNLGACIQQGDYGMRGEQGMFEAVGFRLFNLAGMEASRAHWVHLRIVDEVEESPANQYSGDFWGLYLATENVDEHFLKEHDLPPGNLYKMEFGAKTAFNGDPTITDQRDVHEFANITQRRPPSDDWWTKNLDLARYYNYRSILECIHHYDIDSGKNYFYYRNPVAQKWVVIPWDIDLSWGDNMFGGGQEPFFRAGLLRRSPFKQQYQERLAEIRDLLFNPEQTGKLIDEYAAMIWDPSGKPSFVDADRAKWDYHPILESGHVMSMKAGKGRFYFGKPNNTFRTMVDYMKGYVGKRSRWVDSRLLSDYRPPAAPTVTPPQNLDFSAQTVAFQVNGPAGNPSQVCRWRLAEITETNSPSFHPRQPWKYEIQSLWEQEVKEGQPALIPANLLTPGHVYRVRVRSQDESGTWSRWSAPAQFTVPAR